jgi:hypothetical protein
MTKTMLQQEWAMTIEQAIEAEAQAQAICMQTRTSAAPTRRSPPSKSPCSAGTEHARPDRPPGPALLRRRAPRPGGAPGGLGAAQLVDEPTTAQACRDWVRLLGDAGWLRYCVPAALWRRAGELDSRALVILRETLAFHSPLADFAFAMQGLGSGAITLAGTPQQQAAYLGAVAAATRSRPSR